MTMSTAATTCKACDEGHDHRHKSGCGGKHCCNEAAPCAGKRTMKNRGKQQGVCANLVKKAGFCDGCAKRCPCCGKGIKNPIAGWTCCGNPECMAMVPRCLAPGCNKQCQRDVWHGLFMPHCSRECAMNGQKCSTDGCDSPCAMNPTQDGYMHVCACHGGV